MRDQTASKPVQLRHCSPGILLSQADSTKDAYHKYGDVDCFKTVWGARHAHQVYCLQIVPDMAPTPQLPLSRTSRT